MASVMLAVLPASPEEKFIVEAKKCWKLFPQYFVYTSVVVCFIAEKTKEPRIDP